MTRALFREFTVIVELITKLSNLSKKLFRGEKRGIAEKISRNPCCRSRNSEIHGCRDL